MTPVMSVSLVGVCMALKEVASPAMHYLTGAALPIVDTCRRICNIATS